MLDAWRQKQSAFLVSSVASQGAGQAALPLLTI